MTETATAGAQALGKPSATGGTLGVKGLAWASFEWARNPYYNVIVVSVFATYFAGTVIGDPELGQTLIGLTIAIAGVIMAFVSPVLGVLVDRGPRKKPFVFASLAAIVVACLLLGLVTPDLPGAVPFGMALLVLGYCSYTVSELFHNAMLPGAGNSKALPMISGMGLAMGNLAGFLTLVAIFVYLSAAPASLSEIEVAAREADISRMAAPVIGIWLTIFIIPFFLFMPDVYKKGQTWLGAYRDATKPGNLKNPITYVSEKFRRDPNVMRFLIGRMIYADGIAAVLTIGSTYVIGALGWSQTQITAMGIITAVSAIFGALFGGFLDRTIGPKRAIIVELSVAMTLMTLMISITPDALFFGLIPAGHTVLEGFVFSTLADVTYIGLIIPSTVFLVGCFSSSRYMLVHIAPPERIGEFFGFYAMAGSVTVWLGPGLVALVTYLSGDQRIGFASILVLFMIGLAIIFTVKADKTPEHEKVAS
ncbi:MAG: MFS transporter [Pseudomonadota bacterium]